jgi:hypothetical protein
VQGRPLRGVFAQRSHRLRELVDVVRRSPLLTATALGVGGFLLGVLILFIDKPFVTTPKRLSDSGPFALWAWLIALQTGFWAAALQPLGAIVRELRPHFRPHRAEVVAPAAAFAALVVTFIVVANVARPLKNPLPNYHVKLVLLNLLGTSVALVGVIGISLVHAALADRFPRERTFDEHDLENLLRLQAQLRRLLALDGVIIGAAVLSSGALRNALLAYYKEIDPTFSFPEEYVLVYGAFFSALLALVYAPAHERQRAVARRLRDAFAPLPSPHEPSWSASYDKRSKLEELFELQLTTTASFRTGVAILTPLSAAAFSLLFGTGG